MKQRKERGKYHLILILLLFLLGSGLVLTHGVTQAGGNIGGTANCTACHPGPARDWAKSAMADEFGCEVCHGTGHQTASDYQKAANPTPNTCRPCHQQRVEEFEKGKHSYGWQALGVVGNYKQLPEPVKNNGCEGCHQIGQTWEDGSRGKCNTCHGRHTFSKAEASEPEACGYCHRGDHPQYKIWEGSRHGQLYLQTRDDSRAPKCQTCHMQEGNHDIITAWGFLGLRGEEPDQEWAQLRQPIEKALKDLGPANAPGIKRSTLAEWQASRDKMVTTCANCHSRTFAEERLKKGDQHLKESDRIFSKICSTSYELTEKKIIDDKARVALVRESLAHRLSSFMGAFHGGYEFAWDEGYLALDDDLLKLKGEAETNGILKAIREKLRLKP